MKLTNQQTIEVIDLTIIHHMDGVMCTEDNYREFHNGSNACALCRIFLGNNCENCPLDDAWGTCCVEWRQTLYGMAQNDFVKFHTGEVDLVNRLKREREKLTDEKDSKIKKDDEYQSRKGEEIELSYSCLVVAKLNLPEGRKAIFKFTGEKRSPRGEPYFNNTRIAFWDDGGSPKSILEFVRLVEPVKKGYEIGDEFIYHEKDRQHTAIAWDGMLCKLVRIDDHTDKYEMIMQRKDDKDAMFLDGSDYPRGFKWDTVWDGDRTLHVVRCIDPKFLNVKPDNWSWKVSVTETEDGKVKVALGKEAKAIVSLMPFGYCESKE